MNNILSHWLPHGIPAVVLIVERLVASLKSTGTRDELSITLYLQSEINFCYVRMPVNA